MNAMMPSLGILVKLGSIMVHVEEMLSSGAHDFDTYAIQTLLDDHELRNWIKEMDKHGLLPKKRQ